MTQSCILLCVIEPNNYALTCHKRANLFSENQQNLNNFNTVSYIISQPINVHTDHNLKMLSLIITGFDWPLNGTLLHTLLYCILLWGQGWGDHCKVLIGAVKLFIPAKWTTEISHILHFKIFKQFLKNNFFHKQFFSQIFVSYHIYWVTVTDFKISYLYMKAEKTIKPLFGSMLLDHMGKMEHTLILMPFIQ